MFPKKSAKLAMTRDTTLEALGTPANARHALVTVRPLRFFSVWLVLKFFTLEISDKPVMKCETLQCNVLICGVGEKLITTPDEDNVCCPRQACSASLECEQQQKPICQQDQELHKTTFKNCTDFVCCELYTIKHSLKG